MNNSSRGLAAIALAAPILTGSRGGDYAGVHGHRAAGAQLVASFDPAQGQNPEDLVVARDGTVHATWLFAHSVVAVRPDDSQAVVSFPAGEATGVAIDPRHPGRLTVALISHDPGSAGIWTVLFGAFGGRLRRAPPAVHHQLRIPRQDSPAGISAFLPSWREGSWQPLPSSAWRFSGPALPCAPG